MHRGGAVQDLVLAMCRVVLGEAGDLAEQPGALIVVEPLGREVLRDRPEPHRDVGGQ